MLARRDPTHLPPVTPPAPDPRGRAPRARAVTALVAAVAMTSALTGTARAEGTEPDPYAQPPGGPGVVVVEQQSVPQQYPPPGYPYPGYAGRRETPYEDGMAVPPGAHVESRSRRGLVIAGSILFGISYGITLLVGLGGVSAGSGEFSLLAVPVVGPLLLAANADFEGAFGLALFSTIPQATGVLLFILGLAVRKQVLVFGEGPRATHFALAPTPLPGGAGISLSIF